MHPHLAVLGDLKARLDEDAQVAIALAILERDDRDRLVNRDRFGQPQLDPSLRPGGDDFARGREGNRGHLL